MAPPAITTPITVGLAMAMAGQCLAIDSWEFKLNGGVHAWV